MTNLQRRIDRLERSSGVAAQAGLRLIMMQAGARLAMDVDRCVEVLAEYGFLLAGTGISMLNFLDVPHGLSAQESERYLREHGAEICNPRGRSARPVGQLERDTRRRQYPVSRKATDIY
jgi:hypothetical protein